MEKIAYNKHNIDLRAEINNINNCDYIIDKPSYSM